MSFTHLDSRAISRFNSSKSMDLLYGITSAIGDKIKKKNDHPSRRTLAPSAFRCKRKNFFRLMGVEKDEISSPDTELSFFTHVGTACHEFIQSALLLTHYWVDVNDYLKNNPLPDNFVYTIESKAYETQIMMTSPWPISFACDGILDVEGEHYLLEVKSCTSESFRNLTDPKDEHIDQVKCYCTLLGLSKVMFVYVDRTYGDIKCYEFSVSFDDKETVKSTFDDVVKSAKYSVAPEPLPKGDTWCTSNMCPYYKRCKSW